MYVQSIRAAFPVYSLTHSLPVCISYSCSYAYVLSEKCWILVLPSILNDICSGLDQHKCHRIHNYRHLYNETMNSQPFPILYCSYMYVADKFHLESSRLYSEHLGK